MSEKEKWASVMSYFREIETASMLGGGGGGGSTCNSDEATEGCGCIGGCD